MAKPTMPVAVTEGATFVVQVRKSLVALTKYVPPSMLLQVSVTSPEPL